MKFVIIRIDFKEKAGMWLESCGNKWESFEEAFIAKFWSMQKQDELSRVLWGQDDIIQF